MLVKIFKRRHNGSPKASIDYLLGKERDREQATILRGNPELSLHLAESLLFKNKYTVGCLSFEEKNISEETKQALMDSFESMIFAGLSGEQYNISWIAHKDKGRLELNFFIPNVELLTQKRLQPYYHKKDKILVDSWMQIQNNQYQLSDPHHPAKQQLNKILFTKDMTHTEIKKHIGEAIESGIIEGLITSRQDVTNLLTSTGFTIERMTDKSISISHPELNKNLRLTGVIYEDKPFDERLATTFNHEARAYQSDTDNRIRIAQERFDEALTKRTAFNQRAYRENNKATLQANHHRNSTWDIDNSRTHPFIIKSLSRESNQHALYPKATIPTNNRQIKSEGTLSNQTLRDRQTHTINDTRKQRTNIPKQRRIISIRNLQKIGEQYAKRISESLEQSFRAVRSRVAELVTRKSTIIESKQRIEHSKRTVATAQQCIDETSGAITQSIKHKRLIQKHNHQIEL